VNRREFVALAAAAPFALRGLDLAPRALVTCDSQSQLAVVDLGSHRLVGTVRTLPDPRSIELCGRRAVVCHTAVGAVSVIDPGRAVRVVRGLVEPRYTAAHPDGRHAFVTDSGRSSVAAVDLAAGRIVGRVRLSGWARHIAIDPAGTRLWIGLGSASDAVAVVDVAPFRHVLTLEPGFHAHDVGRAPDGRLWVTSGDAGTLAVGDRRQAADAAPQHVTFGTGRAFVTSGAAGTLRTHLLDGTLIRSAPVPAGSYNVQFGRGRVLTPSLNHGTLAVLDANGMHVVPVADSCHDACFAP
jgi:hypothetical protein